MRQTDYSQALEFKEHKANAGTLSKLVAVAEVFKDDAVELLIVHADIDKNKNRDIKRYFDTILDNNQESFIGMVVVPIFADPHFETFFIKEENAVKAQFSLPASEPLPYANKKPKDALKQMIKEKSNPEKENTEIYKELSERLDMEHLKRRDDDFLIFYNELSGVFNRPTQQ